MKKILIIVLVLILSGCSEPDPRSEMEIIKENMVIEFAEMCDNGETPYTSTYGADWRSAYNSKKTGCDRYKEERDQINERIKKNRSEAHRENLIILAMFLLPVIAVVGVVVGTTLWSERKRNKGEAYLDYHVDSNGKRYVYVEDAVKAQDVGFHLLIFNEIIEKLFMKVLNAVNSGDSTSIAMYLNKHAINQIKATYEREQRKATSQYNRKIIVRCINLADYYQKTATMDALIVDISYIIKANEGDIKRTARLELERASFVETPVEKAEFISNCPNCGAAIENRESKSCTYCGTILPIASFNWTVVSVSLNYEDKEKWSIT